MKDLLVAVPSRGRPGNIERLREAMAATCRGDTSLVVGLDGDDPCLGEYLADPPQGTVIREGMRSVVPWVNALTAGRTGEFRYLGHIGDDNVPVTEGWDVAIMEALEKTPLAFANDLYPRAPGSLCCHVFMRSEAVARLGHFGPPSIEHMYVDVAWMAWGQRVGITYLHKVIIDHVHFTTGRAPLDQSYRLSQDRIGPDLMRWHQYSRGGGLNADIAKIDPHAKPYSREELAAFNAALFIPEVY